jgi:hypothetical protein
MIRIYRFPGIVTDQSKTSARNPSPNPAISMRSAEFGVTSRRKGRGMMIRGKQRGSSPIIQAFTMG